MANLEGIGAPSRDMNGAIGDIYTDKRTSDEYVCTFAYKSGDKSDFECEWRKRNKGVKVQTSSVYGEFKNDVIEDNAKTAEEPTVTNKNETPEIPKRKDYSSYSKKNNNPR